VYLEIIKNFGLILETIAGDQIDQRMGVAGNKIERMSREVSFFRVGGGSDVGSGDIFPPFLSRLGVVNPGTGQ